MRNSDVKYIHFNSGTLSCRAVTLCSSETRRALFANITALSACKFTNYSSINSIDDDSVGGGFVVAVVIVIVIVVVVVVVIETKQ